MTRLQGKSPRGLSRRRARPAALLAVWSATALATGCATDFRRDGLSPHEFARVEHIEIHRAGEPPGHNFHALDGVEGISCNLSRTPRNHPAHKVVTEYEAIYDMKLEAADIGANAIVGVSCRQLAMSQRCYQSIVCTGDAVRLDDGVGMELPLAAMGRLLDASTDPDYIGSPGLYQSVIGFTPDYLTEAQRAGLGTVGVAMPEHTPGRTVEAPPSGDTAMVQGAGLWFVQCAGQGGAIGLVISPLCAAIGAGLGALSAESEHNVATSRHAIHSTLEEFYSHAALRDRAVRVAERSGAATLALQAAPPPDDALARRGNPWRFDEHVDSVIEVGVEELLLPAWRSGATTNLPSPVSVRTRVRVVRLEDAREIYNRSYAFVSDRRLFREWGAQGGAALRHALESGFEQIAEQIIEDLLLAYPLMPGFARIGATAGRRNYVIEPLQPPAHSYRGAGTAQAAVVDSLEPYFLWRPYPGEHVLAADFQGKLRKLRTLRYDLRLYRLEGDRRKAHIILEENNLKATHYRVRQPLAPGTEHVWSVRARFELDTGERTSRWSGDRVGGNVRGFLFRTPD